MRQNGTRGSIAVGVVRGMLALSIGLCAADRGLANPVNLSYLDGQNPVAPDAITAYGVDLFGDKVNLFNGSLEFEHTDLSLPGNSRLPVALVRRHTPGQSPLIRGQFGDWDLEVPRIGGTFSFKMGWVTYNGGVNRCSGFSLPPVVSVPGGGIGGGGETLSNPPSTGTAPAQSGRPPSGAQSIVDAGTIGFIASDYWRRTSLIVPGSGSQEVLRRTATYTAAPTDGNAYPLVTQGNWQIGCTAAILNGAGEGFMAVSPEGVRYRFDWMASRPQLDVKKSGGALGRNDFFLIATLVSDRFGNWVRYTYDPDNPLLLTRIESNDGRVIVVTNAGGRAISASDGTRTVSFVYGASGELSVVQQADGSRWTFNLTPMIPLDIRMLGENANCDSPGDFPADLQVGTITHPSGAVGTFSTTFRLFGRTFVDRVCNYALNSRTITTGAVWPRTVATQALVSKQITGPGMPELLWRYQYNAPGGWSTCTTAACLSEVRAVTVTEPTGDITRHLFGNRWRVNEGQLLRVDEGWNGTSALRSTSYRYRSPTGQRFPDQYGTSLLQNTDWFSARNRPQDQRVISLQGQTFTWQVADLPTGFDEFARPLSVTKQSSFGPLRIEHTAYRDFRGWWVMGLVESVTEAMIGRQIELHEFDGLTALPIARHSFGRKVESYVHNPDGTVGVVRDAADRPTLLSFHRRGKPQRVAHPDGAVESQVINNLGQADSRTNGAGTTTTYQYDAMGRVSRIDYPGGDPVAYAPTIQSFQQVNAPEYGLAAGHWRQTVSTGNGVVQRFFDGLWRERLEVRYDAARAASTAVFEETRYDADGRKAFESYPERTFTSIDAARPGRRTFRDAVDRVVRQEADSELGTLVTSTRYLPGSYQREVTNPRGHITTHAFQAFDTPTEDAITQIWAPEGVRVAIARDVFDKPLSITRSDGVLGVTRSYVYDAYSRLCKTVEPESGATIQQYDAAGNVAWRASGLSLTSTSSCDQLSAPDDRKTNFGYDPRNRLASTTYGDGSPWVTRTYTGDGLPSTINTPSFSWTLSYNNARLMTAESLRTGWGDYLFGYSIDAHRKVAAMSYPGGPVVQYAPDAFGRPTQVSGFVSGAQHHPNGLLASYTAANGIAFSMRQNLRGLPDEWVHGGIVRDKYDYDANGNVVGIADWQEGLTSRTMSYDGLDRLRTANGLWGVGQFDYDALDNLVFSRVGTRTITHQIDGTNRLAALVGSVNLGIGYDANGNAIQRGAQQFRFDVGNRMQSSTGVVGHVYDGHGRRTWTEMSNGRRILRIYGQSGRLLFSDDTVKGATVHVHLGDKVVAEQNSLTGVRWLHTDALGSPVAVTGPGAALVERSRYEPYGATAAGANRDGIGFTGHVNDVDSGLVYMQQRYYDPLASRFLSVDPVVVDAATGAQFGRYRYAKNNPYLFVDPDGRQETNGYTIRVYRYSGGAQSVGAAKAAADARLAQQLSSEVASAARGAKNLFGLISAAVSSSDADDKPSLLDDKAATHVLDGDKTGGGHRAGTGNPGKSEFPKGWSDERIKGEISDVATDPASSRSPGRNGRELVQGTRGGVDIVVVVEPSGRIVTGYPKNGTRNPR